MITSTAFAGKSYAVYGLARSGVATAEALLASGAKVMAWDEKAEAREAFKSSPLAGRGTARSVVEGVPSPAPTSTTRRAAPSPLAGRIRTCNHWNALAPAWLDWMRRIQP